MTTEKKLTGYPSIDKPWLKYYSEEAKNAKMPKKTVYQNIYDNNYEQLSDVALEYFGKKITYKTLFENVENTKKAFIANGIKKGDRVIMFISSTPELVYAILALSRIGAVANLINPLFTDEQICARINETDATLLLVLDQLYGKIEKLIGKTCIKKVVVINVCAEMPKLFGKIASLKMNKKISYNENLLTWKKFIEFGLNIKDVPDAKYEKDLPLIMVYSSGTTGASKGIVLTNDGINATIAHYLSPDFPYERGDRFLQMVPVWFSTGLVLSVLMPVCIGITSILEPVFSKENFAKDIKKYKPNMILGATSLWNYAAQCQELKNCDLSAMKYPITGGEQILPKSEKTINEFLKSHGCKSVLLKGYGMCELGSTVSTDSSSIRRTGSTGFPIKGVTVAAFDIDTNKEQKYLERGEIRVDSPARMKGYYKNPEATDEYFYKDEKGTLWGCTGDIGYVDEDGFIYILGRASDTFSTKNGDKEYCFDIEAEIMKNDNVAQCEVVGLRIENYDVPVAHIIVEKTCTLTENQLIAKIHEQCKKSLSEFAVPAGYKICETFPVKPSGKRDMELIKQDRKGFVIPKNKGIEKIDF